MLPAGEREQAGGIDGPFDLDRRAQLDRPSTDGLEADTVELASMLDALV